MTYRERTAQLLTVKFALEHGYRPRMGNMTAIRHFSFVYQGAGSPDIDVSWYKGLDVDVSWHTGLDHASVSVGNTTTDDAHALELLKRFW